MTSLYQVPIQRADNTSTTLADYRGKVLLIVNVASACGLTPQYTALEAIYERYRERGLVVLGFPCNEEIHAFCTTKFDVKFPILAKLEVNPAHRHPLYKELIAEQPAATFTAGSDFVAKMKGYGIVAESPSDILWNFEKFLVDRAGNAIARFSPDTAPDDPIVLAAIETALAKQ